ncbi:GntR family transcriptional regulator [Orenia metallireducens]|jgi:GntR family transcriptional regulator|uniref:Transcriptional regulator, GntR family n=1 Tax=Orenia metallireducens TaxID=1413210 RepID=A0A285HI36_9FIRM|nr:GntR family transcriptional regulator [Orenia metallireducens]PRX27204.1 GntR family transcriptional regulator [Orenia metallireducens]SNY35337.1 transcriptional regulator, GntR family [Orenia metallireducens]
MKLEDNNIPLYYQIENLIRGKIEKKEYSIGERIPSERELGELFKVSRMTVRKALENLVSEGILERKERKGTFVSRNNLKEFPSLIGVNEYIKAEGMTPNNKIINKELIKPNKRIIKNLNLNSDEKVILIERLILADDKPVGFEQSYISYAICPDLLEIDISQQSIYEMLRRNGHKPTKAKDETSAILADNKLSRLLKVDIKQPILKNIRTTFSKNRPIVYSFNYYGGENFVMTRVIS